MNTHHIMTNICESLAYAVIFADWDNLSQSHRVPDCTMGVPWLYRYEKLSGKIFGMLVCSRIDLNLSLYVWIYYSQWHRLNQYSLVSCILHIHFIEISFEPSIILIKWSESIYNNSNELHCTDIPTHLTIIRCAVQAIYFGPLDTK